MFLLLSQTLFQIRMRMLAGLVPVLELFPILATSPCRRGVFDEELVDLFRGHHEMGGPDAVK